ncbi:MAG: type III-B CRISPR module RAMP protein Cmr6 [Rhodospirillales bacterium]|nr:MAG: type III-B CRISPR module RAMP protein Cmr6 [Rhodospirillales bacterium]
MAADAERRRPLYAESTGARLILTRIGNTGLWYDKFCDRWNQDWNGLGDSGKRDWIAGIANLDGTAAKRVGDAELLREMAQRQRDLASARKGQCFRLATVWRFASGLGRSHPVENGFAWHHGLGAPYLPGSSVKGVARSWAAWKAFRDIDRVFGPEPKAGLHAGSVIFIDALPVDPVALDADVMTPHYGPWYQEGKVPGDWHSPTPIPFLTVAADQTFQFTLLPRTPADGSDCEVAAELLREALNNLGAGAKTAVGYGQFGPVKAETETAAPRARSAGQTELPHGELRAELLDEKTRKGGWKARHLETGIEGPVTGEAPDDCKPGDIVTLVRANRTDFRWATEQDRAQPKKPPRKDGGRPPGKGKGGKRR